MDNLKLIAAFGIGAVIAKAIDAFFVQPYIAKKEVKSWLRDKRLEAYTELTANLLSFGLNKEGLIGPFEHLSHISPSILLTDDADLCDRIYSFIAQRDALFRDGDDQNKSEKELEGIYLKLTQEAKEIVSELKVHIRQV